MGRPVKLFRSLLGPRNGAFALAGVAGFALAAVTGIAIANSFTLKLAKNVKVTNFVTHATKREAIVEGSAGAPVYTLSGETTHHLKCTSATCFMFWPPVKVHSAHVKLTKGPGVKGKLGTLHRNGIFQLTLDGHPLYTFSPDAGKKGVAMGEAVPSFGGTWHVVVDPHGANPGNAPKSTTMTSTSMSTPMPPTTTTAPYPY
jgi:predicted lipoprotein with Yx(FWY)xxD motif